MFGEKSVSAMLRHVESKSTALSVSSLVVLVGSGVYRRLVLSVPAKTNV